jgi:hypothetical protein
MKRRKVYDDTEDLRDNKVVKATALYVLALERREILKEAEKIMRDGTAPEHRFRSLVAVIQKRLRNAGQ